MSRTKHIQELVFCFALFLLVFLVSVWFRGGFFFIVVVLVFSLFFFFFFSRQNGRMEKFTPKERIGGSTHCQGFKQYRYK